jgi:hypothetical protein
MRARALLANCGWLAGQIPRGVGVLLLVAAVLKAYAAASNSSISQSLFVSPRLELLLIEAELILGAWLVLGVGQTLSVPVACAFFAALLAVAVYQGWTGQTSCGCLGRLQVHPWTMAGVDALALLGLLASFTISLSSKQTANGHSWRRCLLATPALIITTVLLVLTFHPQGVRLLARLSGESLLLRPFVSDLGEGQPGEWRVFEVEIINFSDRAVQIIDGSAHCACRTLDDLPVTIPPQGHIRLRIAGRFTERPGQFLQEFFLFTDFREQPQIRGRFRGRVPPYKSAPELRVATATRD